MSKSSFVTERAKNSKKYKYFSDIWQHHMVGYPLMPPAINDNEIRECSLIISWGGAGKVSRTTCQKMFDPPHETPQKIVDPPMRHPPNFLTPPHHQTIKVTQRFCMYKICTALSLCKVNIKLSSACMYLLKIQNYEYHISTQQHYKMLWI